MKRSGVLIFCAVAATASAQGVVDLLPDMITNERRLDDNEIRDDVRPGRTHLTLSNGTANIGNGPLHIFGVHPNHGKAPDDDVQRVKQRIFQSDGSYYDVRAGTFVYHPSHGHTHFEDWAIYRLREVLENNGVGAVVAESDKTSFCLLDSYVYDEEIPGFPGAPVYTTCGEDAQGISVGYEDIYDKSLPDQWIDITDVPDGVYWLESEVDPKNRIIESDESNNIARIKVRLNRGFPGQGPNPVGIFELFRQLLEKFLARLFSLFGGSVN